MSTMFAVAPTDACAGHLDAVFLKVGLRFIAAPTSEQLPQFALMYSYSSRLFFCCGGCGAQIPRRSSGPKNAIRAIMKWLTPRTFETLSVTYELSP